MTAGAARLIWLRVAVVLGGLLLTQLGLRLWLRRWPRPIPPGWSWLLDNPWRRRYRDPARLAERCGLRPGDRVLEVGCGSGLFTPALAARCGQLTALDLQPHYLARAAARCAGLNNVTLQLGDLRALPGPAASTDVVVLISVLTEVPRPVDALRGCLRVLRPGGRIVIGEEFFAPESVCPATTRRWAHAAGLTLLSQQGSSWAYLQIYGRA